MSAGNQTPLSTSGLAAFVAAVEAGSVHGAADVLSLSASAVTKRIQALEGRVGISLFDRGRFGLRPTDAGRLLYPEAKQALNALRSAEQALQSLRTGSASVIDLAASHTIGDFLLPRWLAGFRALHPGVLAKLDIVNSAGVQAAVADGRAEIGFVEGPRELARLETMTLRRDHLVVVVSAKHRWAGRRQVSAAELRSEPYLAREPGSGTRAVAARALGRAGVQLTPALEAASTQSVRRALGETGFALLSQLSVEAGGEAETLRTLDVRDVDLSRELRAVREPGHRVRPAAARFWDWLQAEVRAPV